MPQVAAAGNARVSFHQLPYSLRQEIEHALWLLPMVERPKPRQAIASAMVALNHDRAAMAWVRDRRRRDATIFRPVDFGTGHTPTMVRFSRPALVRLDCADDKALVLFQKVEL